eukprot:TRINITY_DN10094_c0_g2_i1.p1 TRINITY_DN10094_c0_g2~~TRINITY_DN10094_c0_g2_i1.p1  ORF type:complete len:710 (+),score=167.07 TRINITY_DN10094_c0_g2_i1:276-2132(+)
MPQAIGRVTQLALFGNDRLVVMTRQFICTYPLNETQCKYTIEADRYDHWRGLVQADLTCWEAVTARTILTMSFVDDKPSPMSIGPFKNKSSSYVLTSMCANARIRLITTNATRDSLIIMYRWSYSIPPTSFPGGEAMMAALGPTDLATCNPSTNNVFFITYNITTGQKDLIWLTTTNVSAATIASMTRVTAQNMHLSLMYDFNNIGFMTVTKQRLCFTLDMISGFGGTFVYTTVGNNTLVPEFHTTDSSPARKLCLFDSTGSSLFQAVNTSLFTFNVNQLVLPAVTIPMVTQSTSPSPSPADENSKQASKLSRRTVVVIVVCAIFAMGMSSALLVFAYKRKQLSAWRAISQYDDSEHFDIEKPGRLDKQQHQVLTYDDEPLSPALHSTPQADSHSRDGSSRPPDHAIHNDDVDMVLMDTSGEDGALAMQLIAAGDSEAFKSLLTAHPELLEHRNASDRTLLHRAVIYGHPSMVELIVSMAYPALLALKDASGYTAAHWAAMIGDVAVLEAFGSVLEFCLLTMTTEWDDSVLHLCVAEGNIQALQYLLKYDACMLLIGHRNRREQTCIDLARLHGDQEALHILNKYKSNIKQQSSKTVRHALKMRRLRHKWNGRHAPKC